VRRERGPAYAERMAGVKASRDERWQGFAHGGTAGARLNSCVARSRFGVDEAKGNKSCGLVDWREAVAGKAGGRPQQEPMRNREA